MNMIEIIEKKRDGDSLSREEIYYFIRNYTAGNIPDYQAAAFLMAIYFKKLDKEETFYLTDAVSESGDIIDLSPIPGIKVDKHSTGGVGDKMTLIVAPVAAACGVPIAKMSGRGLGFTGGTIDKLESIPGFRTELSPEEFTNCVNENGISIIGQSAQIAKADKLLYALRDVTATMDNISLIASSVMSKKLAAGSDAILLDVKCGSGAFMGTIDEAEELSRLMVQIGNRAGKETMAVITDMSQPLGNAIGNSLEVIEAIQVLKGRGPEDIRELSVFLSGMMIYLGGKAKDPEEGREKALLALSDGGALDSFKKMIVGQGGEVDAVDEFSLFPQAEYQEIITCKESGYIEKIEADVVGRVSQKIGAGRMVKGDSLDLSSGIVFSKKCGDRVEAGECLATLYGNDRDKVALAADGLKDAITIGKEPSIIRPIIREIIGLHGI